MDIDNSRLSRRQIVAGLACTMTITACSGSDAGSSSALSVLQGATSQSPLGGTLTGSATEVAAWQGLTGSQFAAGSYVLRLSSVDAQAITNDRPANLRRQAFTATFDVVQGGTMPGDLIYTLSNSPPFNIFLTNSATNPARMYALFA